MSTTAQPSTAPLKDATMSGERIWEIMFYCDVDGSQLREILDAQFSGYNMIKTVAQHDHPSLPRQVVKYPIWVIFILSYKEAAENCVQTLQAHFETLHPTSLHPVASG